MNWGGIIGEAALDEGFAPMRLVSCQDKAQAIEWLQSELKMGDYVLVKASRGMKFDQIIQELMADNFIQTPRLSETSKGKATLDQPV